LPATKEETVELKLEGIVPPITTPFKDEELDLETLKADFELWNRFDLSGYLVLGSNGENVFLSDQEKDRVVATAREMIPADRFMMVGTGEQSTRATVEATKRAADLGADCALVVTPFYFKGQMSPDRFKAHYYRVAEESPIPTLLYNVPPMTGVNMPGDLVAEMAGHDNIVGVKDSSGNIDQLADILRLSPEGFKVFVGSAPVLYPALCLGADGGILAVANVAPEVCIRIYQAFLAGDPGTALELQQKMTPLAKMVTARWGVGGLKAAMELAGYPPCGVRSPLAMPTEAQVLEILKGELDKVGAGIG
jgi:4-hydroxy-2-oxoglutarate aldolase